MGDGGRKGSREEEEEEVEVDVRWQQPCFTWPIASPLRALRRAAATRVPHRVPYAVADGTIF